MDLGGPMEAQVQAYSLGGNSVHKFSRFRYRFRFCYRFRFRQVAPMCPTTALSSAK